MLSDPASEHASLRPPGLSYTTTTDQNNSSKDPGGGVQAQPRLGLPQAGEEPAADSEVTQTTTSNRSRPSAAKWAQEQQPSQRQQRPSSGRGQKRHRGDMADGANTTSPSANQGPQELQNRLAAVSERTLQYEMALKEKDNELARLKQLLAMKGEQLPGPSAQAGPASVITEQELKQAYCSSVQALKDYLVISNLTSYDITGKNLPEKVTADIKALVHTISKVCLQILKPETPFVLETISKDYSNTTTTDWELDKSHWINVIAQLQLSNLQVLSILHARELHVHKMQMLLQERAAIARQAAELTAAACSSNPMMLDEVSNMTVLVQHGYLYFARNALLLQRVVDMFKESLLREQKTVMELFLKVLYQVLSPVQAALFVVEAFPYHCDVLALSNVLALVFGKDGSNVGNMGPMGNAQAGMGSTDPLDMMMGMGGGGGGPSAAAAAGPSGAGSGGNGMLSMQEAMLLHQQFGGGGSGGGGGGAGPDKLSLLQQQPSGQQDLTGGGLGAAGLGGSLSGGLGGGGLGAGGLSGLSSGGNPAGAQRLNPFGAMAELQSMMGGGGGNGGGSGLDGSALRGGDAGGASGMSAAAVKQELQSLQAAAMARQAAGQMLGPGVAGDMATAKAAAAGGGGLSVYNQQHNMPAGMGGLAQGGGLMDNGVGPSGVGHNPAANLSPDLMGGQGPGLAGPGAKGMAVGGGPGPGLQGAGSLGVVGGLAGAGSLGGGGGGLVGPGSLGGGGLGAGGLGGGPGLFGKGGPQGGAPTLNLSMPGAGGGGLGLGGGGGLGGLGGHADALGPLGQQNSGSLPISTDKSGCTQPAGEGEEQRAKRAKILEIQRDSTLTDEEKGKRIQALHGASQWLAQVVPREDPLGKLTDAERDSVTCGICTSIVDKPVTLPCQHNMCLSCLKSIRKLETTLRRCPYCRTTIKPAFIDGARINTAFVSHLRMLLARSLGGSAVVTARVHREEPEGDGEEEGEQRPEEAFTTSRAVRNGLANACSGSLKMTCPPDHFGPIGPEFDPRRNRDVECPPAPRGWNCGAEQQRCGRASGLWEDLSGNKRNGAHDKDQLTWHNTRRGFLTHIPGIFPSPGFNTAPGLPPPPGCPREFTRYNLALKRSCEEGLPVRVIRSRKEKRSAFAPKDEALKELQELVAAAAAGGGGGAGGGGKNSAPVTTTSPKKRQRGGAGGGGGTGKHTAATAAAAGRQTAVKAKTKKKAEEEDEDDDDDEGSDDDDDGQQDEEGSEEEGERSSEVGSEDDDDEEDEAEEEDDDGDEKGGKKGKAAAGTGGPSPSSTVQVAEAKAFAPVRYDGIYRVLACWRGKGAANYLVCRWGRERGDQGLGRIPERAAKEIAAAKKLGEEVTYMTKTPAWDYDSAKGEWGWTRAPPATQNKAAGGGGAAKPHSEKSLGKQLEGKLEGGDGPARHNSRPSRTASQRKPCPARGCGKDLTAFMKDVQVNNAMASQAASAAEAIQRKEAEVAVMKRRMEGKEEPTIERGEGEEDEKGQEEGEFKEENGAAVGAAKEAESVEKDGRKDVQEQEQEEAAAVAAAVAVAVAAAVQGGDGPQGKGATDTLLKEAPGGTAKAGGAPVAAVGVVAELQASPAAAAAVPAAAAAANGGRGDGDGDGGSLRWSTEATCIAERHPDFDVELISGLLEDQGGDVAEVEAYIKRIKRSQQQQQKTPKFPRRQSAGTSKRSHKKGAGGLGRKSKSLTAGDADEQMEAEDGAEEGEDGKEKRKEAVDDMDVDVGKVEDKPQGAAVLAAAKGKAGVLDVGLRVAKRSLLAKTKQGTGP
ncbi:hypothetical protein VOLCADRAFT_99696 [Volvox carteri f. nagariensis]|uniref:RING-type domain-containing protein n=1 Tax=Volvox carteri f. nagariensis TaxID=3068 RepID=D8UIE5_VOLCA|nr:uncharacterized protein VOLCADRAFT_99696 [Volvox carteri f. nagariensis]EFJ40496.1 hypothetical protein VOLCADRAFT_99696 [Volvox carteri f. nagariensis]|eukprot:XP_002958420.1 hypothetical protein VOLCADRAFT_99696 [Volvox carteri f. nagariensis]